MKTYDIITGELKTRRIQLEVKRIFSELRMDPTSMIRGMEVSMLEDQMSRQLVATVMATVAAKKYDVKTVRFPKDWWQSFKKEYFPMWAIVRWPVQYEEVTMEANAYYPEIEIPNKQAFVEVCIRETARKEWEA